MIFDLHAPQRFLGDENGWVRGVECIRTELGEPDASGRRRPVPVPGSEFTMETDLVVIALGTNPNPLVPQTTYGLDVDSHGCIVADPKTGATSRGRVRRRRHRYRRCHGHPAMELQPEGRDRHPRAPATAGR